MAQKALDTIEARLQRPHAHFAHAARAHVCNQDKTGLFVQNRTTPTTCSLSPLFLCFVFCRGGVNRSQPFDTVKVRLQTQDVPSVATAAATAVGNNPPKVKGAMTCAVETVSKEGERFC